ncbi:nitrite reductase large subunit NirB [Xanthovirga aplysinae]|uniref:nitrite reductase large subunit NirB n=1 Tax=Xanthovirga aplysinae TaxID=2529853 RepID=UPI0012BC53E5|nr:nitrite reductase large subunit NirB [Xanthovirga aplysinae]MTI29973.1 nitrite reductase large subunit [Xanthovirga aplysinae]
MQHKNIIVIGNGMVGYKFCEKLVEKDLNLANRVIVFGEESFVAYDRVHLSEYFEGKTPADLAMAPRSWYEDNNLMLYSGDPIVQVDLATKTVTSRKGQSFTFDKLVFATGSSAFVPPIKGREKEGVFVYRTIEDLERIKAYAKDKKSGTVIGGGLLGLEAAKALLDLQLETHVVEFSPKLMPRQLDEMGSEMLKSKMEELQISIHINKNTRQFTGESKVDGLSFEDEDMLKTDMVVISAGISPRDELAKQIGLKIGPRGGIVVNDKMQTSHPDIYAIGECALHNEMIFGLVGPGYEMADVVVRQLLEQDAAFTGFDMSTKLKLIGVDVASFGDALGQKPGKSIVYENKSKGIYKRINISKSGKLLLGGVLVGDTSEYNMLCQMVNNKIKIPEDAETLIMQGGNRASQIGVGVEALPGTAMICSCESVDKGTLISAVQQGATDLPELKSCTKAGSGCGGCLPMVKDLMVYQLKEMGITVKKTLCEHFELSRQELFHLIKVKGYRTFTEVLQKEGKGYGCELCKPAVGSILASIWNDPILKQDTIHDTNDRFLANIQRGGTYSVVPRIPGGEITPDKLIVIGQVAKKYGLYTKITGGQRIDMFGARLNDLPNIWKILVDAGFETGQAYGKSVRTVKSCVGSTWCRFGVQDSLTMAIDIENRYKGLRAPHKIKFAVSGCTRECAEAQNKDIGIIATEKGWAMYICGNGGSKPQHGVLFATDIDTESCIKYIDRLLMLYIRTAEPLNRTATWFNKLEGGLEYLRDVIIHDSLGICEDLEKDMENHVNTYICEWKDVVEDPEKQKKFRHFVNSEGSDETLEFIDIRGQKVPANW